MKSPVGGIVTTTGRPFRALRSAAPLKPDIGSAAAIDDVVKVVEGMEQRNAHALARLDETQDLGRLLFPPDGKAPTAVVYEVPHLEHADEQAAILAAAEKRMTAWARQGWRWRILRLRADIDAEIERTKGVPSDALDAMFDTLGEVLHTATPGAVSPPSRGNLLQQRG